MSDDWTEIYRPHGLSEVVGNPKAVEELKAWADAWENGRPAKRAAVLIGTPGTGKTSAALALAADYGWDVVEMNASDQRNADAIKGIALRGAIGQTFTSDGEYRSTKQGKLKLIILDEADNISGREDRGGVPAIVEVVRTTKQPVILIVNDWYALTKKSSVLKSQTEQIKFTRIKTVTVRGVLRRIAKDQEIKVSDGALELLSENSGGDLRSAIRDLQAVATGRQEVGDLDTTVVSAREVEKTMYQAMDSVFKSSDAKGARARMAEVEETPDAKLLWIEENLPIAYRDHLDLYRGMREVAKASAYLGRVQRRQHYGFWSYAGDMLSFGVCAAKRKEVRGYVRYAFPSYLMKMSRSKSVRAVQSQVCSKIGERVHMSVAGVRQDLLPYFRSMFKTDKEFQLRMAIDLQLEDEEVAFILEDKIDSNAVKHVMSSIKKVLEAKDQRMEKAIDRKKAIDALDEPLTTMPKPQPSPSQRTLF
ncbi:MAG: replication factor C large subunit [Methanomassiliicoccus sp.]|nr:replication factor C large subunit [Methanomassiliicoccus sp.]